MKWCSRILKLKFGLCPLFLVSVLLLPCTAYSWTLSEWIGVIEASGGLATAVAREVDTPVGDTCQNCGGTGKVGDGTVFVPCAACDGTGKTIKSTDNKPSNFDSSANEKKETTGKPVESFPKTAVRNSYG